MKRILLALSLLFIFNTAPSQAQFGGCLPGFCGKPPLACPVAGAEAAAFLARAIALDARHICGYIILINGLVSDGIWTKLDGLYIFATQNSTTALLNLVSTNYTGITHGSPTFTPDQGFTGVTSSSTIYIDTQFNPTTAVAPKFTLNSSHVSCFNVSDGFDDGYCIGVNDSSPSSTLTQVRVRDAFLARAAWGLNGAAVNVLTNGFPINLVLSNRPDSTHVEGWVGSGQQRNDVVNSTNLANRNISVIALNNAGTQVGTGFTTGANSWGAGLTVTDVPNLYARLHTWMQEFAGIP